MAGVSDHESRAISGDLLLRARQGIASACGRARDAAASAAQQPERANARAARADRVLRESQSRSDVRRVTGDVGKGSVDDEGGIAAVVARAQVIGTPASRRLIRQRLAAGPAEAAAGRRRHQPAGTPAFRFAEKRNHAMSAANTAAPSHGATAPAHSLPNPCGARPKYTATPAITSPTIPSPPTNP